LTLAVGPRDEDITTFAMLAAECIEPKSKRPKGKDWVSKGTWTLIAKRVSLLQSGRCDQAAARRMKRKIHQALKADKQRLTADVGKKIVAELGSVNVKEAFRHLKGWYPAASETQAAPCPQTMVRQTDERVALYAKREA
jgi:hypothetical protein